jgi:restriction system protein
MLISLGLLLVAAKASVSDPSSSTLVTIAVVTGVIAMAVGALLIYKSLRANAEAEALRVLSMSNVDEMSGIEFEEFVSELLHAQGYTIRLTPINDFGVDIIARRDGESTAIQTKRYAKPVGLGAVQQVYAGMAQHRCTQCMVVTNSQYTSGAIRLAEVNHCRLVNRDELARWMATLDSTPRRDTPQQMNPL